MNVHLSATHFFCVFNNIFCLVPKGIKNLQKITKPRTNTKSKVVRVTKLKN